ncbi:MAG: hypothetical protein WBA57_19650 [Elainellaceae cyanobacterium]
MNRPSKECSNLDSGEQFLLTQHLGKSETLSEESKWLSETFNRQHYLYATYAHKKPAWKSVRKYKALSESDMFRLWQDPDCFIGSRFWSETNYFLLDIDIGSLYHPTKGEESVAEMLEALEEIGIVRHLKIVSSASKGIHLYFPLPRKYKLWKVALIVRSVLHDHGFDIVNGVLEIFPNYIPFTPGQLPIYKGHRLPLQRDSYLLDKGYVKKHSNLSKFIEAWNTAASKQDDNLFNSRIEQLNSCRKGTKKEEIHEWEERLSSILEVGWTEDGQTQEIVKTACMYGRVFVGLNWNLLEKYVLKIIISAPGYKQFCGHQKDIERVVKDWVKTNKKSNHYYPSASRFQYRRNELSEASNKRKKEIARDKIAEAVKKIRDHQTQLVHSTTKLATALQTHTRCSYTTLYKHKDLWHPKHRRDVRG